MKEHYTGHRQRLKQRFSKEPESLYDYEVIELLLGYVIRGRDVKPQAKALIEKAGGISGVAGYSMADVEGLGDEAKFFFSVLKELYSRISYEEIEIETVTIDNPEKAASFLRFRIGYEQKEQFFALFMDVNKKLLGYKTFFKGTVDRLSVYPREIAEEALKRKASFVIVAHNHPAGSLNPSEEDITLTDKLIKALGALDIAMADHIIVSKTGFFSFKKEHVI
ncbi:DNA repair protein RadC [Seleniivibrio sp.]|uniref:JAB domain-containing protein n=1 Tax=Seleniivibrio sp. TaxID=2898801 RepID=UPI0025EBC798|nr:DNA repair protein RadC [Seleniivibrio sp.]MCD8553188.1 DNA repair protein RadC [Seleniivibrio sp.]